MSQNNEKDSLEPVTKENYPRLKEELKHKLKKTIIISFLFTLPDIAIFLLFGLSPGLYDDGFDIFAYIVASFYLVILLLNVPSAIRDAVQELNAVNNAYMALASEEERSIAEKDKHKHRAVFICIASVIAAGLITLIAVNTAKTARAYRNAVSLYDKGQYQAAQNAFEEIEDKHFRDTDAYIIYCEAHKAYNYRNISDAQFYAVVWFKEQNAHFWHLSAEQQEAEDLFLETVHREYGEYLDRKHQREEKRAGTIAVPYVGMHEELIGKTSLGAPSNDVKHGTKMVNGESRRTNSYYFKDGEATIFIAHCVNGQVYEVFDHRDDPLLPYTPKKSTRKKEDYDFYDVNDYSTEEDFYYDHYDDFYDFEEAEDYYNEHHK